MEHPSAVQKKLAKEIQVGRIAGPFFKAPFSHFCCSPLGLVEKKVPGTFRLIHHLSHPEGLSVNDGIPTHFSQVHYQTIDDAVTEIRKLGRGCFLAKTDIANAFRIVPLHPSEYPLLGFTWEGKFYFDRCLPMGCSSSCKIFEALSSALHWIAENRLGIPNIVHVLDDFLILDRNGRGCGHKLKHFTDMCATIGIPIAPDKTHAPDTTMTFLGYELDTRKMEVRLPTEKLDQCQALIRECLRRPKMTLRELQTIIGTLNFACGVVLPGRAFLRRLINLTIGVQKPYYYLRITRSVREDLLLWRAFLQGFNGRSLMLPDRWLNSQDIQLFTDAAGSLGYGATLRSQWFYGAWDAAWMNQSTSLLELYPIVLAVKLWGPQLANQCILFRTDNEALVDIINQQSSKDVRIMHLVRELVLRCLVQNILFKAVHIPGRENVLADLLSRQQVNRFHQLAPHMAAHPVRIPPLPALPT
jgi:hypothetical protein